MAAELSSLIRAVLASPPRCGPVRVVAIDGGAASGKSTLAARLGAELPAAVLHTDELLDGWDGQFTFWPRLRAEVLAPLAAGRPGHYRRYDWLAGSFAGTVTVPVPNILVVEGVSALAACAGYASTEIFLDLDRAARERRWIDRDGPLEPAWRCWLDAEDEFFAAHPPGPDVLRRPG